MKRISSHYLYFSPDRLSKNLVVEIDDRGIITSFFNRDEQLYESSNTLFYDGVLSLTPVSLKKNLSSDEIEAIKNKFQYLDFSEDSSHSFVVDSEKPLVLDFNSDDSSAINSMLAENNSLLQNIPIAELINSCVNRPLTLLNMTSQPTVGESAHFIVWNGIYLPQLQITPQLRILKV